MGFADLFWLFFVISTLQPAMKQWMLQASRARLIARIERLRGSRVILLVHRQETMSLLGFPLVRYIDINDAEDVPRACELTDPEVPFDIVLHTPGGGTLIALAAEQIVLSRHAVLGPVDAQVGEYPAASLLKVVSKKPIAEVDDKTLVLGRRRGEGHQAAPGRREGPSHAKPVPGKGQGTGRAACRGTWTHDYPITFEEAQQLGLNVSSDMPRDVLQLMSLFPQPTRRQPSVEFLPGPRRAESPKRDGSR